MIAVWLAASVVSAVAVGIDIAAAGGQQMWIMDLVWPITALWAGPFGAVGYLGAGRPGNQRSRDHRDQPFSVIAAKATAHCGAGCTLADLVAAGLAIAVPFTIAGHELFAEWVYGLVGAFVFGIAFQYFTIKPMRDLTVRQGLVAAIKADTLSLAAWQLGMYGWMAIARFAIYKHPLAKDDTTFWLMLQVAMLAGFITSYPVNVLLLRHGLKERM